MERDKGAASYLLVVATPQIALLLGRLGLVDRLKLLHTSRPELFQSTTLLVPLVFITLIIGEEEGVLSVRRQR